MKPFARALRLQSIWDWLPVFRVVAETEHLPTASKALHVSPSALSRTVRLLEGQLGSELFTRDGRALRLNERGQRLLLHVRDAMRLVDDAVEELQDEALRGVVRVSVEAPLSSIFVLPAVEAIAARHPGLIVELVDRSPEELSAALRSGALDIAITERVQATAGLHVQELAILEHVIVCAKTHPLPRGRVSMERVLSHAFVVPQHGGAWRDPWPLHLERRTGLRASHMATVIDACAGGGFLAVLPSRVARAHGLRRVGAPFEERTRLYLARRTPLPTHGRIDVVADTIVARAC